MEISSASLARGRPPLRQRVVVFIGVVAFHICIIGLLIFSKQAAQQSKKQGALSVFALAAAPGPPAIPVPVAVMAAEPSSTMSSLAEALAEQQAAEGDPDGEVCSPIDAITEHLASDPLVFDAIQRVPRADRSISEAIVMWNAEWSSVANAEAPLANVRKNVTLILETLPPDCLALPVIGPRLVAISDKGYTTFLAFGSGEWSWQQVIEAQEAPSVDDDWTWEELLDGDDLQIF